MKKVLVLDNILGSIKEEELTDTYPNNYINGLTIQFIPPSSIRINRGEIVINSNYHTLSSYKTIPLSNIPFIESNPSGKGIVWLYVRDKGGGELSANDFYLSKKYHPNADIFNKTFNYLNHFNGTQALYIHNMPKYRCIAGLYFKNIDKRNIIKFDLAYLGYWESIWYKFTEVNFRRNSVNTLNHGLGFNPKSWNVWFKPTDDSKYWSFQSYYTSGGFFQTSYGVTIYDHISNDEIILRTGNRIFYYKDKDNSGWFNNGYIKWIVRCF